MENIEKVFNDYTSEFISGQDNQSGYVDKYHHSYFVMEESLIVDQLFTQYNEDFKQLLKIQSLYHDIGRFEQLRLIGSFIDYDLASKFKSIRDHGDLGAIIMEKEGLLEKIIPNSRLFDEEIKAVIILHVKNNPYLLEMIDKNYLECFRNYSLTELFNSTKATNERNCLTALNTAIIQDADRLDIFRKIVKGIWIPNTTGEDISKEVWELFKSGNLPAIKELKDKGLWNTNVGHLVRMNFINQMCLVPELQKIKDENLIEKVYQICGNEKVRPAYDYALERIDTLIEKSEDKVLVKK